MSSSKASQTKAVGFYNMKTARLLEYTSKMLEAPFSTPLLIATYTPGRTNGILSHSVINATGCNNAGYLGYGGMQGCDKGAFQMVLSKCQTFVIGDGMLLLRWCLDVYIHNDNEFDANDIMIAITV
jgi:hypothetical protein